MDTLVIDQFKILFFYVHFFSHKGQYNTTLPSGSGVCTLYLYNCIKMIIFEPYLSTFKVNKILKGSWVIRIETGWDLRQNRPFKFSLPKSLIHRLEPKNVDGKINPDQRGL